MASNLTFVTGASGFIGSHVVRLLQMRGDRIRILARNSSRMENLEGPACEIVIGDLKDATSLIRCIQGCNKVYHIAADYRFWARDPQEIYDNNVAGTRNLLSACCEAGVEKVIYTSTATTIGLRDDGRPADEEDYGSLDDMIGHYHRSKFMAEQVARQIAQSGAPVVIVNPTIPVGAGDVRPTPTGKMILEFINRRIPAYVDTGVNLVGVADVAEGHLLAEKYGRVGERYILGGENWSLAEIMETLARISGLRTPRIPIPWLLALIVAYMDEFVMGTLLRREPFIPLDAVRMARRRMFLSCEKARQELGYNPRPVEHSLREAVEYFRHHWRPAAAKNRASKFRANTA